MSKFAFIFGPSQNRGNGGQSETIKYYDPGKSMYDYALNLTCGAAPAEEASEEDKTTYNTCKANVTPGVTGNYFSIASESLLGTAQAAQFQSGNQYGANWHWLTRKNLAGETIYSNDGNQTAANADSGFSIWHVSGDIWLENNIRAQMPRSYADGNNGYGTYLNWYAATAESGSWSSTSEVDDSLCPKGWKLPIDGAASSTKSWGGLLAGAYALTSDANSSVAMRQQPLSVAFSGYYSLVYGSKIGLDENGLFWDSTAHATSFARSLFSNTSSIVTRSSGSKPNGLTVRCVKD